MSTACDDHAAGAQHHSKDNVETNRTHTDYDLQEYAETDSESESVEFLPWSLRNVRSRREKLRRRDYNRRNLPWRFFTLPLASTRRVVTVGGEEAELPSASDSEDCTPSRRRITGRKTTASERHWPPCDERQSGMISLHQETERQLPCVAIHSCRYCSSFVLDMRKGRKDLADAVNELQFEKVPNVVRCAEDGCLPYQQIVAMHSGDHVNSMDLELDGLTFYYGGDNVLGLFDLYAPIEHGLETSLVDDSMPPNLVPDSDLSFTRARQWLDECQRAHAPCRDHGTAFMPKRLLHIKTSASSVRLIETSMTAPYAALSYCWGGDQAAKLTSLNRAEYEDGVQVTKLPQTIRDAVKVTRGIGLQYLWVDALCLIQDDEADKTEQISHMHNIYRGSYVTISATTAESSDDSFLEPRVAWRPTRMRVRWDDNVYSDVLITPRYVGEIDHKIFTRGWTFQELHLPPRILSFGRRGMMYACLEARCYDGGLPYSLNKAALDPGMCSIHEQRHPLRWMEIVRLYSARKLSVEADKLLAIAGLADEYLRTAPATDYLAGLWREDLLPQLAWKPMYVRETSRPLEHRAPSWSWPALDGEVMFEAERRGFSSSMRDHFTSHLLEACNVDDRRNRHGMCAGGHLKIKGRLKKLQWTLAGQYLHRGTDLDDRLSVYLDVVSEWTPGMRPLFTCLELYTYFETESQQERNMKNSFALILHPVGNGDYRRVGTLHTHRNIDQQYWFDSDYDVGIVTII